MPDLTPDQQAQHHAARLQKIGVRPAVTERQRLESLLARLEADRETNARQIAHVHHLLAALPS